MVSPPASSSEGSLLLCCPYKIIACGTTLDILVMIPEAWAKMTSAYYDLGGSVLTMLLCFLYGDVKYTSCMTKMARF
ncbi:hypothetical protein HZB02_05055 [Candidatus Woesearchaeota archaeon]|nr:hypothetical protein [Candidatus Woesearchaeota archaeon]